MLMKGRTTLVIAQRLLTLKNADSNVVLDHGEIIDAAPMTNCSDKKDSTNRSTTCN